MKKFTIALITILSFLVSSRLIYKESFYRFGGTHKIPITERDYYNSNKWSTSVKKIEKEYDYLMGGIISLSIGILLTGYNHFKKK